MPTLTRAMVKAVIVTSNNSAMQKTAAQDESQASITFWKRKGRLRNSSQLCILSTVPPSTAQGTSGTKRPANDSNNAETSCTSNKKLKQDSSGKLKITETSSALNKKRKQSTPEKRNITQKVQPTVGNDPVPKAFCIPRHSFAMLVREILRENTRDISVISKPALEALQSATEIYLMMFFQDAYLLTLHRQRVTLSSKDFQLMRHLKDIDRK